MGMLYFLVLGHSTPVDMLWFENTIPSFTQTQFGLLDCSAEACIVLRWSWGGDVLENHDCFRLTILFEAECDGLLSTMKQKSVARARSQDASRGNF